MDVADGLGASIAAQAVQALRVCVTHPGGPVRAYQRAMRAYLDGELDDVAWVELASTVEEHFAERLAHPTSQIDRDAIALAYAVAHALFWRVPDREALAAVEIR